LISYNFTINIKLPNRLDYALALPLLLYRLLRYGYIYRRIPLTQGKFAKVDPEDYYELIRYKWCACCYGSVYYAKRTIWRGGKKITVGIQRIVMKAPKETIVDHIDGDPLNNCKFNLRFATNRQNSINRRALLGRTSKYKGVHYDRPRDCYRARITFNGRLISLGRFEDEVEAAKAYDKAAKKYHGEFARLNFPDK
jgi:hypothetical protein